MRRVRGWFEDPDLEGLGIAARAAIVMPVCFAISNEVIGNPQMAIFSAFGSFSLLVLVDFGGPVRSRFVAYLALAVSGLVLITLGTLCSHHAWLAASAMGLIGFGVLFSGVISGYFAAAGPAALLSFVLAVMVAAPASDIPSRLAGWSFAAAASIAAVMLLWPARHQRRLRAEIAASCRALADQIEAAAGGDVEGAAQVGDETIETIRSVRATYLATPYRPTGPTGPPAAIAALVEDLAWLRPFAARTPLDPQQRQLRRAAAEVGAAVVQTLRASASAVEGGDERPDLEALGRARETVADDFDRRIRELGGTHDEAGVAATLEEAYRMRSLSYAALQLAVHALGAAGEPEANLRLLEEDRPERVETMPSTRIGRAGEVARSYASGRSVWFRNSLRAAIGLALAVLVAQLLNLEHSFWVVLGTLSVLRSNALGTGSTVLEAIAGTFAGIVIGGLLVYLIGADRALLWAALPIAILIGAYAPRAISFAAGQGGFTIVVVILFNLIEPGGWEVGLVRIQDVAIGCGISLAVGLMFWPRGAASVVRRALASAYAGAAEYLTAVVEMLLRGGDPLAVERVDLAAVAASRRLDDAFRQFLSERPLERHSYHDLATLLAGVTRIRRTGHSLRASSVLARLGPLNPAEFSDGAGPARELEREVDGLTHWYGKLSQSITSRSAPPAPEPGGDPPGGRFSALIHVAAGAEDEAELLRVLGIAWTSRHLETLRHLEPHLAAAAAELADAN